MSAPSFLLSEEHEEFRGALRRFAEKEIAPHAAEADEREAYPQASMAALRDSGFVRALYPAEHGGDAGDLLTAALVIEEVARACGSSALTALVTRTGVTALMVHGTPELRDRVLPPVVAGEQQASYCLSEPNAGSDAASMTTRAVRDGDQWVLNGRKAWITSAGVSDVYTVFAKTDPAAGSRSISAFVVEHDGAGLSIGKLEHKMGLRGSPTGEVVLEDVAVPAGNLIGEQGRGFHYALEALDRSRPIIAAQAIGLAQGALDVAGAYILERRQFDQRIADFQGVQFMLADMATQLEAARLLVYSACARVDAGATGITKASSMAKLFATDTAMRVTTDAVQLLGGAGTTREFPVERMMRDVKITQIYEGTNQIQRVVIARKLLDELTTGT
ncbi:MAG TPA: acyl-CoA dehydrogenase family protein [Acidimicrobiia bacterium]|nr:acyl-CoA dehydrogenase family protein [Acidimicrobiia bacterium]